MDIHIPAANIWRVADTSAAPRIGPDFPELGDIVTVGRGQTQWRVCEVIRARYARSSDRVILRDLKWKTRWAHVADLFLVYHASEIANGDPMHVG